MKKRIITLFMILCMTISLVACGGTGEREISYEVSDEPVTIRMFYKNSYGEHTQTVQDAANEMLKGMKGYEHISIELVPSDNHSTDLQYAMAAGDQIDIVSSYGLKNFNDMVAAGDFIPLDDLMKQFPDAISEIPDWVVEKGKVYGEQYFIPTYQQATNLTFITVPTKYMDMYYKETGKTRQEVSELIVTGSVDDKLDFLEDLVNAVRKGTGKKTKWIFPSEYWGENLLSNVFFNQEYIANRQFGNYILREGAETPEYWGLTEEFKTVQERFNEWYYSGLLHSECTTMNYHKVTGANFLNDEAYVNQFITNTCSEEYLEEYLTDTYGLEMTAFRVTDHAYIPAEWEAGGHAIYTNCEHPAEAMMIIELLRSEKGKDFYNLLCYGIEGIHYEWEDKKNDKIITLEYEAAQGGDTYQGFKWVHGNVFNAWKNQSVREGFYEYILEEVHEGEDTVFSPASGITWDTKDVENQMIQIAAIQGEYGSNFYLAKDWETRYNEYVKKLKNAGIEDVMSTLTKQYQEHLKK